MPVKIRLSRQGRSKSPFYAIVVADSRAPRDGKFIEKIGSYNPLTKPATIELDRLKAYDWLEKGAQPTDTAKAILKFKGVFFRKHLMRGVKKGAMSLEQAEAKWQEWIDGKESKIEARKAQTKADSETFRKLVAGSAKPKVVVADVTSKETAEAYMEIPTSTEEIETVAEEIAVVNVETAVEEITIVNEEAAVEVAEETVSEVKEDVVESNTEDAPEA